MKNLIMKNSDTAIKLINGDTAQTMASVVYSMKETPYRHLYIDCIASKEKQKGFYSRLFKEIKNLAIKNKCKSLRMKTGSSNEYRGVVEMHQKYGFIPLPQSDLDKQRGRIGLEKSL